MRKICGNNIFVTVDRLLLVVNLFVVQTNLDMPVNYDSGQSLIHAYWFGLRFSAVPVFTFC